MKRVRLAVSAALVLGAAAMVPARAARPITTGSGTCADGTVSYSPSTLWPPNHKMQTITVNYTAPANALDTAQGDTTTITVGMIVDNQANSDGTGEAPGSGQPTAQQGLDWSGTGNSATSNEGDTATTTFRVRSERSGTIPTGRTYTVTLMCSEHNAAGVMDPNGSGMTTITVTVPHDQGHNA